MGNKSNPMLVIRYIKCEAMHVDIRSFTADEFVLLNNSVEHLLAIIATTCILSQKLSHIIVDAQRHKLTYNYLDNISEKDLCIYIYYTHLVQIDILNTLYYIQKIEDSDAVANQGRSKSGASSKSMAASCNYNKAEHGQNGTSLSLSSSRPITPNLYISSLNCDYG
eukprot:432411_1